MANINWGLLDTSLPAKIAAAPMGAYENTLANIQQRDMNKRQMRLADLGIQAKEQEMADAAAMRNAYATGGGDMEKTVGALTSAGLGGQAFNLRKQMLEQKKMQGDMDLSAAKTKLAQLDITKQAVSTLLSNPSDENISRQLTDLVKSGAMSMQEATAHQKSLLGMPPMQRYQAIAAYGMKADEAIKMLTPQYADAGGSLVNKNPFAVPTQDISKTASPEATLSAQTARRGQDLLDTRTRELAPLKITHGIQGLSDDQKDALNRAVAEGRLDPNRINSKTASIYADLEMRSPGTDYGKISGDIALGRNPQFRTKAIVAETLPEIMTNMVKMGKKLDYSDARAIGNMQAWVKGQLNDPQWTEYMALRNDALMTIAGVMRGVGMTDMAHKAETEVASPSMSPRALDAWLSGQMHALEPRLKNYRRITKEGPQKEAPAAEGAAFSDPDKERRYQEWKAKQK